MTIAIKMAKVPVITSGTGANGTDLVPGLVSRGAAEAGVEHKVPRYTALTAFCTTQRDNYGFCKFAIRKLCLSLVLQLPVTPMQVASFGNITKKITGIITNVLSENNSQLHSKNITNISLVLYTTFNQQLKALRFQ